MINLWVCWAGLFYYAEQQIWALTWKIYFSYSALNQVPSQARAHTHTHTKHLLTLVICLTYTIIWGCQNICWVYRQHICCYAVNLLLLPHICIPNLLSCYDTETCCLSGRERQTYSTVASGIRSVLTYGRWVWIPALPLMRWVTSVSPNFTFCKSLTVTAQTSWDCC